MVSSICYAQYSNHQLYQAYLTRDMNIWQQYIVSTHWDSLKVEEKKQLVNYEYGFTAYILGQDQEEARKHISLFEQHLNALKHQLPQAQYYAYLSCVYTYKLGLDKKHLMKYASGIFDNIKRAMELDDEDPLVLSMQGNVEFYSPFGNKKKALEYYQKSNTLYHQMPDAKELWNVRAVQMTIVQCLAKMNRAEEAKQQCELFLKEEPNCLIFQTLMADLTSKNL